MNAFDAAGKGAQGYTYSLTNNCDLHVTKLLNGQPTKQAAFSLETAQFRRYDYANSLGYAVRTTNQSVVINDLVFESESVASIESMLQLLERIKTDCIGASASGQER